MQSSPLTLYRQSIDKQRVAVAGKGSSRIAKFILFVLNQFNRKVDYSTSEGEKISDASVVIVECLDAEQLLGYHHHILILSQLEPDLESHYLNLANATPKGGTILFDETDPLASAIAKAERADVTSNSFAIAKHEMQNGKALLITSTNEKFPTPFSSVDDLKNMSAAKELLKKIGISSGQFYGAIGSFQ